MTQSTSQTAPDEQPEGAVWIAESGAGRLAQRITAGHHELTADEPRPAGEDTGPTPYDLLRAALGSCTSMTLRMFADRSEYPLDGVTVALRHSRIHAEDCADCESPTGLVDQIERDIQLDGDLTGEQRRRLLEIADKCHVHKTLLGEITVTTREIRR